jgi:DNA-binding NarL/FixJ family response regulator
MSLTILIVDNNALFLGLVRKLLSRFSEVIVVGEAGNGIDALLQAEKLRPDLMLLDIAMPGMSGLEVALTMANWSIRPAILFVTMHEVAHYVDIAKKHGALGVVGKADLVNDLLPWIQKEVDQKKAKESVLSLANGKQIE